LQNVSCLFEALESLRILVQNAQWMLSPEGSATRTIGISPQKRGGWTVYRRATSGTRIAHEAASSYGACSREIVATFNAEATQRNIADARQRPRIANEDDAGVQEQSSEWRRRNCDADYYFHY